MRSSDSDHKGIRNTRRAGFIAGGLVGFAVLYLFAQSLGYVGEAIPSVGVFGAAAGAVGGRIGGRWGAKGVLLGIAVAVLGAVAGTYFSYLITLSSG